MSDYLNHLKCCECEEFYTDPRRLPLCSHTYCSDCITRITEDSDCITRITEDRTITCPACLQDQTLPPNGAQGLEQNVSITNSLERLKCADCCTIDENIRVCNMCNISVCQQCQHAHTDPMKCDALSRLRDLKNKLPSDQQTDVLLELYSEWESVEEHIPKTEDEVNRIFATIMENMKNARDRMIEDLRETKMKAEATLRGIRTIVSTEEFINDSRAQLRETRDRRLDDVTRQSDIRDQLIDNAMPKLLNDWWPPRVEAVVENLAEVADQFVTQLESTQIWPEREYDKLQD